MNSVTAMAFADEIEKIASPVTRHPCKECGKTHAPKCDRCGSTRDLRSYHGPCGKCAFSKNASEAAELLKFAKIEWGTIPTRIGEDMVGTVENLRRPVQGAKSAWNATGKGWGGHLNKGLFALGTYAGGQQAISKTDPSGQGRGRGERIGRFIGGTAAGLASMPHSRGMWGIPTGIAAGMVGESVGGIGGRVLDRLRGYKPPTALPPSQNPHARVATAPS